jgi:hypothetical protein
MERFKKEVTELTPAVCGPDYEGRVEIAAAAGGRVDVLARRGPDGVYLFAANAGRQNAKATFTLDKPVRRVEVFDQPGKLVIESGNSFIDTFRPLEVHIYRLGL